MSAFDYGIDGAKPCPFCQSTFLYLQKGAVACDTCQAEGPFIGCHFDDGDSDDEGRAKIDRAVRLWNARSAAGFARAAERVTVVL